MKNYNCGKQTIGQNNIKVIISVLESDWLTQDHLNDEITYHWFKWYVGERNI